MGPLDPPFGDPYCPTAQIDFGAKVRADKKHGCCAGTGRSPETQREGLLLEAFVFPPRNGSQGLTRISPNPRQKASLWSVPRPSGCK
jgi:hypothetical protein